VRDSSRPDRKNGRPADRGVRDVAELERLAIRSRSWLDHVAAHITRLAGSASAILIQIAWVAIWIALNGSFLGMDPFDPFPYSLLTTIVSLEAIFLTLFVLINQNRMSREADHRAELDLQVNLLAEKESTMVLRILHDISKHLGLKGAASKDLAELLKETRLDEISRKLDKALPPDQ
jgi:uncharacterized membrane protein